MKIIFKHYYFVVFFNIRLAFSPNSKKIQLNCLVIRADSKLLILHADDLGLSHSTNMAVIKAFENNAISPQA